MNLLLLAVRVHWELHNKYKDIDPYEDVYYGMVCGTSEHDFAVGIASCWLGECELAIATTKGASAGQVMFRMMMSRNWTKRTLKSIWKGLVLS